MKMNSWMAKDAGMFKINEANKTAPMRIIETICLQKVHLSFVYDLIKKNPTLF